MDEQELEQSHGDEERDLLRTIRARLHRLADTVHRHEGAMAAHEVKLGEYGARQEMLIKSMEVLRSSTPTRDDLKVAISASEAVLTGKLDYFHRENSIKLDHLTEKIEPISAALSRVAWLIIVAVIAALLALVIVRPDLRDAKSPAPSAAHP